MMLPRSQFRLRVRRVDQSCLFDLMDATGRELTATIPYEPTLTHLYQTWQQIYRQRYQLSSRARVSHQGGSGTPTSYDWDQELRLAETALLQAFHHWLGRAELLDIRGCLQQALTQAGTTPVDSHCPVELLLDCSPLELARLPWETWTLTSSQMSVDRLRIARTVTTELGNLPLNPSHRRQLRVLAVFGEAADLKPERDYQALCDLAPFADIIPFYCQSDSYPANSSIDVKQQLAEAIADERGWDILFFAGHSDESATMGGKLELRLGVTLSLWEIAPQLTIAQQRGLRLAIFNSCSGLDLAEALIRLGVSQVVVMREQIHDDVAHIFLQQFCQRLAACQDIHTALQGSCDYLATEQISYPSAYLVPSLFRHPDPQAALFQLEPSRWKRLWQGWQPTWREVMILGTITLLSLITPIRESLSEYRYWATALYRHTTQQFPATTQPPVTIVAIDQASIERHGIDTYKVKPIDRTYLAKIIDRLRQLNVRVIGVDYFLDGTTTVDQPLQTSLNTAIQQATWFVFATRSNDTGQPIRVSPQLVNPRLILQGTIEILDWNLMQPNRLDCHPACPFAYQIALAYRLHQLPTTYGAPHPALQLTNSLQTQVNAYLNSHAPTTISPIVRSGQQMGLTPILDFSLPPNRVYQQIAAWEFLERPLQDPTLQALQSQAVIIASGGYDQADDNFPVPLAIEFWRSLNRSFSPNRSQVFTGGEAHAYTVHHWLKHHHVWQIPDLWLIGIVAILGKGVQGQLLTQTALQRRRSRIGLIGATITYGLITLQSYLSLAVLLPWFLPSVLFWSYLLPQRKS